MDTKIRNHVTTVCMLFVKQNFPDEYKLIVEFAKQNYQGGRPHFVASTVLSQMEAARKKQLITDVL